MQLTRPAPRQLVGAVLAADPGVRPTTAEVATSVNEPVTTETRVASSGRGVLSRLSGYVANGLRYWEPRRIIYNGVLSMVVLAHVALAWPGSRTKLSFDLALGVFLLAVLANVCYCAAYVADIFVQFSGLHEAWRVGRAVLLVVGTTFAATITHFCAKAMLGE
jgi:hypothetical protein